MKNSCSAEYLRIANRNCMDQDQINCLPAHQRTNRMEHSKRLSLSSQNRRPLVPSNAHLLYWKYSSCNYLQYSLITSFLPHQPYCYNLLLCTRSCHRRTNHRRNVHDYYNNPQLHTFHRQRCNFFQLSFSIIQFCYKLKNLVRELKHYSSWLE